MGKPYFIKKKLLIGGLIISLTSLATNVRASGVSCYEPPPPPNTLYTGWLAYNAEDSSFIINVSEQGVLNFAMGNIEGDEVCFELKDTEGNIITEGMLRPKDGELNNKTFGMEAFEIALPDDIQEGYYLLHVYTIEATDDEKKRTQTNPEFISIKIER